MGVVVYSNPRCSKSRAALALLAEKGISYREVHYLETPISPCELEGLANALGIEPLEFMRTKEKRFAELGLSRDDDRTRDEWFRIISENIILLERPIVVNGNKARIGRPTESILEILQD